MILVNLILVSRIICVLTRISRIGHSLGFWQIFMSALNLNQLLNNADLNWLLFCLRQRLELIHFSFLSFLIVFNNLLYDLGRFNEIGESVCPQSYLSVTLGDKDYFLIDNFQFQSIRGFLKVTFVRETEWLNLSKWNLLGRRIFDRITLWLPNDKCGWVEIHRQMPSVVGVAH